MADESMMEEPSSALQRRPVPLPATREDFLAQYRLKRRRTINDYVEDVVIRIWDDENFTKHIDAIYESQAVEGSLDDDDTMAALIIREFARNNNLPVVANSKIHTVKLAMRVVLKRYGQGRHQRPLEPEPLPAPQAAEQAAE